MRFRRFGKTHLLKFCQSIEVSIWNPHLPLGVFCVRQTSQELLKEVKEGSITCLGDSLDE
jgi:hypothetical protein